MDREILRKSKRGEMANLRKRLWFVEMGGAGSAKKDDDLCHFD